MDGTIFPHNYTPMLFLRTPRADHPDHTRFCNERLKADTQNAVLHITLS